MPHTLSSVEEYEEMRGIKVRASGFEVISKFMFLLNILNSFQNTIVLEHRR
jgi:hypothetical protein